VEALVRGAEGEVTSMASGVEPLLFSSSVALLLFVAGVTGGADGGAFLVGLAKNG